MGLGGIRDTPDPRDIPYVPPAALLKSLPKRVDLRKQFPPVYNQGQINSCHDDETEVLTDSGFRLFSELSGNELLATVDPATSELSFERPARIVRIPYKGPMICADNWSLNFKVTPDHKMLVRKWNQAKRTLSDTYELVEAGQLGRFFGLMNGIVRSGDEGVSENCALADVDRRHTLRRTAPVLSVMSDGRAIDGDHDINRISVGSAKDLTIDRKEQIFKDDYEGMVYCAEVKPHHTLVTRRHRRILISGNCTANAIAGAMEFDALRQGVKHATTPSRLFVYYNERVMTGTQGQDSGGQIRDGIKSIVNQGDCPENRWPYLQKMVTEKPAAGCYSQAKSFKALKYQRIDHNLDHMKACLASGFPFVFGFVVYSSFQGASVMRTGHLGMPRKGEKMVGLHAVVACGYDDAKRWFIVRNSWGSGWGIDGYYTMPYEYLQDSKLSHDFWTIRVVR